MRFVPYFGDACLVHLVHIPLIFPRSFDLIGLIVPHPLASKVAFYFLRLLEITEAAFFVDSMLKCLPLLCRLDDNKMYMLRSCDDP